MNDLHDSIFMTRTTLTMTPHLSTRQKKTINFTVLQFYLQKKLLLHVHGGRSFLTIGLIVVTVTERLQAPASA